MLNLKVKDLRGGRGLAGEMYGVEVEVEGSNLPQEGLKYWSPKFDGSLRGNALEYVFAQPLGKEKSIDAVHFLRKRFTEAQSRVRESIRAGIHIHKNVNDWTGLQLLTFLTVYYICEEVLVDMCGESRQGNMFCLRLKDAEDIEDCLILAYNRERLEYLNTDNIRYAALNLSSIPNLGSIEFRAIRTTKDFHTEIEKWINIFSTMEKNVSLLFHSPVEVIEAFSHGGEEEFLRAVFREYAGYPLGVPNYKEKIWHGVRLAQEIAFSINL